MAVSRRTDNKTLDHPLGQAFRILQVAFVLVPLLAGLDKFVERLVGFHVLTDWTRYLAPVFPRNLGVEPHTFMLGVGFIEVAAAILVALAPRYGAYLVAAWLAGIVLNLLILGQYYDIALRDVGLALSALALGRLAQSTAQQPVDVHVEREEHEDRVPVGRHSSSIQTPTR